MTIDWWTLGLQTVNLVVLVWLLKKFFWAPVSAMIEQRRVAAGKTLSDAEAKHTQAAAALAEIEKTRAGFAAERDAILAEARATAEQARASILADAAKQAVSLEASAKAATATEQQAAQKAWADRSSRLAVEIAGRLAARLDGAIVRGVFLDWLVAAILALPADARRAAGADDIALDAISATPIDPADQGSYRDRISAAIGGHPRITFRTEPALVAGLELQGAHFVVGNSWRADLSSILAELVHDDGR